MKGCKLLYMLIAEQAFIMNNTSCLVEPLEELYSNPYYIAYVLGSSILIGTLGNGLWF